MNFEMTGNVSIRGGGTHLPLKFSYNIYNNLYIMCLILVNEIQFLNQMYFQWTWRANE